MAPYPKWRSVTGSVPQGSVLGSVSDRDSGIQHPQELVLSSGARHLDTEELLPLLPLEGDPFPFPVLVLGALKV